MTESAVQFKHVHVNYRHCCWWVLLLSSSSEKGKAAL